MVFYCQKRVRKEKIMIMLFIFFLLLGPALAIFWWIVLTVSSFVIFVIACILAAVGVHLDVSGEKNLWYLLLVVAGISWWVYLQNWEGWGLGLAIFVFLTGAFSLFRSADNYKING